MSPPRNLTLEEAARITLEEMRDHHPTAYMRERAAARNGWLRRRHWETVASWLDRYQQQGLAGLSIEAGRGRKPAFSP
jgi:transposase